MGHRVARAIGILAVIAGAAVGALPATAQTTPAAGKTLRVGTPALAPTRGNVFSTFGLPSMYSWYAMFDPLTVMDLSGRAQPALAVSWKNTSPTTWEFKLREGVTFSNGEPLNAQTVIDTINWLHSPEGNAKGASIAARVKFITRTRAIDATTVELTTEQPDPIVPNLIGIMLVVPSKAWRDAGLEGFTANPVGTGPYRQVTWTGDKAELTAFNQSWRKPKIPNLLLAELPEQATRVQALQSGQIDVMLQLTANNLDAVRKMGGVVDINLAPDVLSLAFTQVNAKEGVDVTPYKDRRVRQALNHAVDKQAIEKSIMADGAMGKVASQGMPSTGVGYNPSLKPYPYDPALARRMLSEAGYDNKLSFKVEIVEGGNFDLYQQVALDLAKVGVTMTVIPSTFATRLRNMRDILWESAVWQYNWNVAPAMDGITAMYNHSCNKAGKPYLCDAVQQKMIDQISVELDPAKRLSMLQELVKLQRDEAVNLFLFENTDVNALSPKVKNFRFVNRYIAYHDIELVD